MTTAVTCRECDASIDLSTRRAYSDLFGSRSLNRLSEEMEDVLSLDAPGLSAGALLLRAIENWLGHDADALVQAVRHRMTEGYSS